MKGAGCEVVVLHAVHLPGRKAVEPMPRHQYPCSRQNVHIRKSGGAFTGDNFRRYAARPRRIRHQAILSAVSILLRRTKTVNKRAKAVLAAGLKVIVCVASLPSANRA